MTVALTKQRFGHAWPIRRICYTLILLSGASLGSVPARALIMRDTGPEPVIVQIKDSLRLSLSLDAALLNLATVEQQAGVTVAKRWAGRKYMELVEFPEGFSEAQALGVIAQLQATPAAEQVVALSAYNLVFKSGDFIREYGSTDEVPDAARRGLDLHDIDPEWRKLRQPDLTRPHVPNQIVVAWKPQFVWNADQTGFLQQVAAFNAANGCTLLSQDDSGATRLKQLLEFNPAVTSLSGLLSTYASSNWVDYAQPNYTYAPQVAIPAPNDILYPQQSNLSIIQAPFAWSVNTGSYGVTIANIDSGFLTHPDLADNISPYSTAFSDKKGTIPGRPLLPLGGPPVESDNVYQHGTHTASIIGAEGNNVSEMTGLAWQVMLMHLRITFTSYTASNAIEYAATYGPTTAANCSFGEATPVSGYDPSIYNAVGFAQSKNLLVVGAAGNNGVDLDTTQTYSDPASVPFDNVISVAASDNNDALAGFSNFGQYSVALAAPGVGILGLAALPDGYSFLDGTSLSAPQVSGAAALIKSEYEWEDYLGIRDRIMMGVDHPAALTGKLRTSGRLNVASAITERTTLRNLSARARVESGDNVLIGGFSVGPVNVANPATNRSLKVVIRGLGPSLQNITNRLADPYLDLYDSSGKQIASNDDWGTLSAQDQQTLQNNGLTPTAQYESAIVVTLAPGMYTAVLHAYGDLPYEFGVGTVEIYTVDQPPLPAEPNAVARTTYQQTRLVNLSARCKVGIGEEIAIAGFITEDGGTSSPQRRVLARAIGPSLAYQGVSSPVLSDPQLQLFDSRGNLIASNNDWGSLPNRLQEELGANYYAPNDARESVVWPTLYRGVYTAQMSGVNSATGVGLIEFYEY